MSEPVILIDVMNLVFRSHFAHPNLQADGKHTGVQFGILKTINELRTNVSPRMVFCWDHGIPVLGAQRPRNWRETVNPQYKANRTRNEDVYRIVVSQLLDIACIIECLGYSNIGIMGMEADDVIGLLSHSYPKSLVYSSDKDFYQLLQRTGVEILVPKKDKKGFRIITAKEIEKEHGISVDRWAEYLALGGDSADNIKPMRGMGPKTAIKLLLNGADLRGNATFEEQSKSFQAAHEKYREAWPKILGSYHAAQIPTDPQDSRIAECLKYCEYSIPAGTQQWRNEKHKRTSFDKFVQFCADRNMISILSIRQKYFSENHFQESKQQTPCPVRKEQPKHRLV